MGMTDVIAEVSSLLTNRTFRHDRTSLTIRFFQYGKHNICIIANPQGFGKQNFEFFVFYQRIPALAAGQPGSNHEKTLENA